MENKIQLLSAAPWSVQSCHTGRGCGMAGFPMMDEEGGREVWAEEEEEEEESAMRMRWKSDKH